MRMTTTYRIEHIREAKFWSLVDQTQPVETGFWDGDQDFLVEFDDEDEAYALADKIDGMVVLHRKGTFGSRMALGAVREAAE